MKQKPNCGSTGLATQQARLCSLYREYRKLLVRSYVLRLRAEGLSALVLLTSGFAPPGWLMLLRRWFDTLKADVAEFHHVTRAFRVQLRALPAQPLPPPPPREFQNPWL